MVSQRFPPTPVRRSLKARTKVSMISASTSGSAVLLSNAASGHEPTYFAAASPSKR